MNLLFNEKDHSYTSLDDSDIKWISVTSVISKLKKPFDANKVAKKVPGIYPRPIRIYRRRDL